MEHFQEVQERERPVIQPRSHGELNVYNRSPSADFGDSLGVTTPAYMPGLQSAIIVTDVLSGRLQQYRAKVPVPDLRPYCHAGVTLTQRGDYTGGMRRL